MRERPRLAVLIGAPHKGDASMHNDLIAMYDALQTRGLGSEEILSLEGNLDRQMLMSFLKEVGHRMALWRVGELFLYFSGHGFFVGDTVENARVGVKLQDAHQEMAEYHVYWDEMLCALAIPAAVTCTMLPDH